MKYIKTFELYDVNFTNYEIENIDINNREVDVTMKLYVKISEHSYEFTLWFNRDNMLYFDYHIIYWSLDFKSKNNKYYKDSWSDNKHKYNYIANKNLMIKVLNFLPEMVEIFKSNVKDTKHYTRNVLGWYYDSDELRRASIYEYYFDKKFKDKISEKDMSNYKKYFFKQPIMLKDFYL